VGFSVVFLFLERLIISLLLKNSQIKKALQTPQENE
jgi:hypothetical protein